MEICTTETASLRKRGVRRKVKLALRCEPQITNKIESMQLWHRWVCTLEYETNRWYF